MTLHTTYKESVEEFEKEFTFLYEPSEDPMRTFHDTDDYLIIKHNFEITLHTHTLKMLDVQIAWMEGKKKDTLEEAKKGITAAQATAGYNIALKDSITHLQEQRALIELGIRCNVEMRE